MNILQHAASLPGAPRRTCVAIGVFDGVHLGHQQVIRQTIHDASHFEAASVVVTFDRHPNHVVAPHAVPPAIQTLDQKLETIAALGAANTLVIPFDSSFSRLTGEAFIRDLMQGFGSIRSICVGRDFTFGHKRSGNVGLLERLGAEQRFKVHGLAAVALDGEVVSSTRIRDCIRSGNLDAAGQMLGREFTLRGKVIRGDGIGRQLGYPTANIDIRGFATPPTGVHTVHVIRSGTVLRGVANLGVRPTLGRPEPSLQLEVHLFDFDEDIYEETLDVQFLDHLRPEQKFASLDALKLQIAKDVKTARGRF